MVWAPLMEITNVIVLLCIQFSIVTSSIIDTVIFLGLIWGRISAPCPLPNSKMSKILYIIPNFLVLHFGENFMAKLLIHENLHKMWMKTCIHSHFYATFHEFYEGQLKQQMPLICFLTHLKWWSSFSKNSPISLFQMPFSQIQQAPGPDFRKVGKSLR